IAKPSPSNIRSESEIFSRQGIPEIPPFLREGAAVIDDAKKGKYTDIIQPGDIRGIVHSHSDWSDGSHSIEEMALGCIQKGYEYLVISDHSKTAAYANGLPEDRIRQQ